MLKFPLLLVLSILFTCCKPQTKENDLDASVYKIKTGNRNVNEIGYLLDEKTGEVTSVSCIYIRDKNILLLDPVHNNIKVLDINTGALTKVSDRISEKPVWLSDLISFDDFIYVASYNDVAYVLDHSLNKIKEFQIDNPFGEKRFFLDKGKLYICTYSTDYWQDKEYGISVVGTEINDSGTVGKDTVFVGRGYEAYEEKIAGYRVREGDGSSCIIANEDVFCVKNKIPTVPYPSRNVFVHEGVLSFFELQKDSLKVTVYKIR